MSKSFDDVTRLNDTTKVGNIVSYLRIVANDLEQGNVFLSDTEYERPDFVDFKGVWFAVEISERPIQDV